MPVVAISTAELDASSLEHAYAAMLAKHLPRGDAWRFGSGSTFYRLLLGLATELSLVHGRLLDFERELDPRLTDELLPEWEEFLGLPDECVEETQGVVLRRAAVLAKMLDDGDFTVASLIALAERYGYEIRVEEFHPFVIGTSGMGDSLISDGNPFTVGTSGMGDALGVYNAWWTMFEVIASAYVVEYFHMGSAMGTHLGRLINTGLECELRKAVPASMTVLFRYETRLIPDPALVTLTLPRPALDSLVGHEEEDMGFILTQTSDSTGSDWVSSPTVNPAGWINLPCAELMYPYLLRNGWVEWLLTGNYFNLSGAAQGFVYEFLVNEAPLAAPVVFTFAQVGVVPVGSVHILRARLEIVGSTSVASPERYPLSLEWIILDNTGAVLHVDKAQMGLPVINGYVDQYHSFRVMRQNAIAQCKIDFQSVQAIQPMRRSGG